MNLKAFLWFVYKLKFHIIAALAFNVNKYILGVGAILSAERSQELPCQRELRAKREGVLGRDSGERNRKSLAKPHCLRPLLSARRHRLPRGLPPSKLWAKSKMLEMFPRWDDHLRTQAALWSPVSFVLWPSFSPSGGQVGNRIPAPPLLLVWAPDTQWHWPGCKRGCKAARPSATRIGQEDLNPLA